MPYVFMPTCELYISVREYYTQYMVLYDFHSYKQFDSFQLQLRMKTVWILSLFNLLYNLPMPTEKNWVRRNIWRTEPPSPNRVNNGPLQNDNELFSHTAHNN